MQLNKIWDILNFKITAKLLSCILLVIVSDFFFYNQELGWTLGIFGFLLIAVIHLHNKKIWSHKLATIVSCASLGLVLALMGNPTELSFWLCYLTIIFMAVSTRLTKNDDARVILLVVLRYLLTGWRRFCRDNIIIAYANKRWRKISGHKRVLLRNLVLPIGLSAAFISLFTQANPIINAVIGDIRWSDIMEYFSVWRILSWLLTACLSWALIRPRLKQRAYHDKEYPVGKEFTLISLLFNELSVFTSLILFNILFLMQNAMDIAFLWSGAALPVGMTHAQYAHQGAYPLIATALLTAIFILIAFKPQSTIENRKVIRSLVYVWVGQNVFLVISSITRLMNYIGEYSLTYMRVAALIWMVLVALGLILIVSRIYLQRSNKWLVNINAIALYSTLYICCFINFGGIIAGYNVEHSREAEGSNGIYLDISYLQTEIGADAIPALLWFEQNRPADPNLQTIQRIRMALQYDIKYSLLSWRAWTFRKYRLLQEAEKPIYKQE